MMRHARQMLGTAIACTVASACAHAVCVSEPNMFMHHPLPEDLSTYPTEGFSHLLVRGTKSLCTGQRYAALFGNDPDGSWPTLRQTPDHIIVTPIAQDNQHVVWLRTHQTQTHFYGPVALIRRSTGKISVLAIGILSLPKGDVHLAWLNLGTFDALWATSRSCSVKAPNTQALCQTTLSVLPRHQGELLAGQNAPEVYLEREHADLLDSGWRRVFVQRTVVDIQDGALGLKETVAVVDKHLVRRDVPARNARQAEAARLMTWRDGAWTLSGPDLWEGMRKRSLWLELSR